MFIKNKNGSAMIIALITLILLTIMSTVFIEKLWRFHDASEGIENSNVAYYHALGMIEETLNAPGVDKYTPWNVMNSNVPLGTQGARGKIMTVATGSSTVPAAGKGNSLYNSGYNIIALGEPIQLVIPNGITNWDNVTFEFRVPITDSGAMSSTGVDATKNLSGAILWTLASSGGISLFASGETNIIQMQDINLASVHLTSKNGTSNTGSILTFGNFYNDSTPNFLGANGAKCANYACTLKLSLIRPVPLSNGRNINFLEYKIIFPPGTMIPSQYMTLTSKGYAGGFLRTREIQFPQITTNTALDFAVLQ